MKNRFALHAAIRFLRSVLLIDLAMVALVAVVCLVGGWNSFYHFANGLLIAGLAALAFGVLGTLGGWGVTRGFLYRYAQTASQDSIAESTLRDQQETEHGLAFTVRMSLAGLLSCALGTWILASIS
jgi:hypothetical protein